MFVKIIKTVLMILGALFLCLIVYSKAVGRANHWNKNVGIDVKQEFTRAYLILPDNTVRVFKVKSWNDYDNDCDVTYLTHASRVILTDEKAQN